MAYCEVHQSLLDHRKLIVAAEALDIEEVHLMGHLVALWLWSLDNAPNGVLPQSMRMIGRAARWSGDPTRLVSALKLAGFLDLHEDGSFVIHDWQDYGGKLTESRLKNAARQRAFRERNKQQGEGVTVTSPLHNRNVTAETRQDKTRVEKTRQDKTSIQPADRTEEADYKAQEDVVRLQVIQAGSNKVPPVSTEEVDLVMRQLRAEGKGNKCRVKGYVESVLYGNRQKTATATSITNSTGPPYAYTAPDPNRFAAVEKVRQMVAEHEPR